MSEMDRSELACPVCGQHMLALEEPPRIDVMGVQANSDMLGMGDLAGAVLPVIVCRACGTRWRDRAAFDRNDPEAPDEAGGSVDEPADEDWAMAEAEAEADPELRSQ